MRWSAVWTAHSTAEFSSLFVPFFWASPGPYSYCVTHEGYFTLSLSCGSSEGRAHISNSGLRQAINKHEMKLKMGSIWHTEGKVLRSVVGDRRWVTQSRHLIEVWAQARPLHLSHPQVSQLSNEGDHLYLTGLLGQNSEMCLSCCSTQSYAELWWCLQPVFVFPWNSPSGYAVSLFFLFVFPSSDCELTAVRAGGKIRKEGLCKRPKIQSSFLS